jgi:hypothetical protein
MFGVGTRKLAFYVKSFMNIKTHFVVVVVVVVVASQHAIVHNQPSVANRVSKSGPYLIGQDGIGLHGDDLVGFLQVVGDVVAFVGSKIIYNSRMLGHFHGLSFGTT